MTITVSCPSCSTTFPVDPSKVPEGGVNARCSECTAIFFVEKPAQFEAPEAVEPTPEQATVAEELPHVATEGVAEAYAAPEEAAAEPSPEAEEPVRAEEVEEEDDDWVIEREPESETEAPEFEPLETIESQQRAALDAAAEEPATEEVEAGPAVEEVEAEPAAEEVEAEPAGEEVEAEAPAEEWEVPGEEPEPEEGQVPEALETEAAPAPKGFQFGKRDPHDKARRLARVLVSDMIMYNPERHQKALEQGSLQADFEDEIKKSWDEYTEQVGEEIANDTSYFTDALNDILAKGEQVFHGLPE